MKTIQIDFNRFWALIKGHRTKDNMIDVDIVLRIVDSLSCHNVNSNNECRYDSGYCSLCDMKFNDSKGKRITHPEPE